jgi:hypothetical protein
MCSLPSEGNENPAHHTYHHSWAMKSLKKWMLLSDLTWPTRKEELYLALSD